MALPLEFAKIAAEQAGAVGFLQEIGLAKYVVETDSYEPFCPLFGDFVKKQASLPQVVEVVAQVETVAPEEISGLELQLYEYLKQRADRVCDFKEIAESVWSARYGANDEEDDKARRRIQVTVSRLRQKLKKNRWGDISSIRERGYRWLPPNA